MEILGARPYAFLDDAPLEERRTQAVAARRWLDPQSAAEFGQLDPAAIAQVRSEAWPSVENADEMHDALMLLGIVAESGMPEWHALVRLRWCSSDAPRVSYTGCRELLGCSGAAADARGGLHASERFSAVEDPGRVRSA